MCVLLTLHHQLDQRLSGFHIEAVVLARLATVRPAHVSCHVADSQDTVVALHLSRAIWHQSHSWHCCPALLHPRPQDDWFGFPWDQTLQVHGVALLSDEVRTAPGDSQLRRNCKDRDRKTPGSIKLSVCLNVLRLLTTHTVQVSLVISSNTPTT